MSVADEPVVVYRFRAGKVESADGSYQAALPGITTKPIDAPLALPRGPTLDHSVVFAGQDGLRLPVSPALAGADCFAIDMLIRVDRGSNTRMQLLASDAPCMALTLAPAAEPDRELDALCLQGALHLRHTGTTSVHWCGTRAVESVPLSSDTASQRAFTAPNAAWVCVALVFTGDDLVLLQDGAVVARRVWDAAELAPAPAPRDVLAVGADLEGNHVLHGAVAAVRLWNGVPALYAAAVAAAARAGVGALASKRAELEEGGLHLGRELRAERSLRLTGAAGRICEHERGLLLWSRETGAHAVHGPIHAAYGTPGWRSRLGWPIADERASSAERHAGACIQRFQRGAVVWSQATGAHPVHGPMFARYLALGGESGLLGLPVQAPQRMQHGAFQDFQHGRLVHTAAGAHALFGPTLTRYRALPRRVELLGHPVADTTPIHGPDGALLGHVSHFERGAIYWSPQHGAWEVCGRLGFHYQCSGGPLGGLGFPVAAAHDGRHGTTTHARFERGLIAQRAALGTFTLHAVRLRLERVRRLRNSSIDSFVVRVWLRADDHWIHRGTRLPAQGHATSNAILAQTHLVPVQPETELWLKIEVCDAAHDDRVAGSIERRFDTGDLWGAWSGNRGRHEVPIAVGHDAHAFVVTFRVSAATPVAPARLPAVPPELGVAGNVAFAQLGWWRFGNFRVRTLAGDLLAESFRPPLPADSACWPAPPAPALDSLFAPSFRDVHAGVAANGSCFGMVTAALRALAGSARVTQPVYRYHLIPEVRDEILRCHAQQLGAELIGWFASLLATPAELSPRAVFDRVERALRASMPVALCIYDVPGDRGDCLLAYASTRADEEHGRIYVADPNAPRSLGRDEPAFVRVRADDTFQLVHEPERFRSQPAGDGLLPDVLLLPVPFHVLAAMPGLPAAAPGLAHEDLLGGLVLLSGDAEIEQVASRAHELQRKIGGRRHLAAHALPGFIRVPRLQASPASQVYAQRGPLPDQLDLHVRGTKARGGRFTLCVGTQHGEVRVEAAIARGALDTVELRAVRTSALHLHLSTTMAAKLASVACRIHRDPRGRPPRGLVLTLPLASGEAAVVHADGPGGAVIVRPAGKPQPMDVILEAPAGGRLQRFVLRGLMPQTAGEALRIRPRDWSAPGGEIVVERLASLDGAVLARHVTRGRTP